MDDEHSPERSKRILMNVLNGRDIVATESEEEADEEIEQRLAALGYKE